MNAEAPTEMLMERDRKISPRHHERTAVVYIRQSTIQQVRQHRESTQAQYGLADLARRMGWSKDRILVIDEDLGQSGASAENRAGFQRLLSEVALDHVGMILGIEMSRLARSCRDWYQLLELCAIFGTLICDLDGLYDPVAYNDRLLLGLKGTISEAELHIIRQRMQQGIQQKARRGDLISTVPIGYIRDADGLAQLDSDEQVRTTVLSIFDLFARIGTIRGVLMHMHSSGMQIGVRIAKGPERGRLVWRRPNTSTLRNILTSPIYAGAYAYGRRGTRKSVNGSGGRYLKPASQWLVLLRDRMPAYIAWEQYQANLEQLRQNRSAVQSKGAIRKGRALLSGLVICGRCGYRLATCYSGWTCHPRYDCRAASTVYGEARCQGLAAAALDAEVVRLALLALEPSALEVSLQVAGDLKVQHDAAEKLWTQRIERAEYEADRARRQYDAVEPENRLVARTIEAEWERKLQTHRELLDQHERFLREQPHLLTAEEQQQIRSLAGDLPTLWNAATTTDQDRKTILRQIIDKVVVNIEGDTEWVEARIQWIGGQQTYTRLRRPVIRIEQLSEFTAIRQNIIELHDSGMHAPQIAVRLNDHGFRTCDGTPFTSQSVRTWLSRYGSGPIIRCQSPDDVPNEDEWYLSTLARKLGVNPLTILKWVRQKQLKARRQTAGLRAWIVRATESDLRELMAFRDEQSTHSNEDRRRRFRQHQQRDNVSGGAL
jgi:DNA invertase Pin-like site-specific DNA recombinase